SAGDPVGVVEGLPRADIVRSEPDTVRDHGLAVLDRAVGESAHGRPLLLEHPLPLRLLASVPFADDSIDPCCRVDGDFAPPREKLRQPVVMIGMSMRDEYGAKRLSQSVHPCS